VFELIELIGRLPRKIQFSIETRIDLMRPELLRALRRVGLNSITVGIETPANETLRQYSRAPVREDRQREFVDTCRGLGIRTVAGFMIGFPDDDEQAVRRVLGYSLTVNPTFANYNIVTPYPGTQFFEEMKDRIADFDFSRYTVYNPVMKYENITPKRLSELHAKCFNRFYFRWSYLRDNAHLFWPSLRRFGVGRSATPTPGADPAHEGVPKPLGSDRCGELLSSKSMRRDGPHRRKPGGKMGQF